MSIDILIKYFSAFVFTLHLKILQKNIFTFLRDWKSLRFDIIECQHGTETNPSKDSNFMTQFFPIYMYNWKMHFPILEIPHSWNLIFGRYSACANKSKQISAMWNAVCAVMCTWENNNVNAFECFLIMELEFNIVWCYVEQQPEMNFSVKLFIPSVDVYFVCFVYLIAN